ncbi:hypothetical protein FJTKL_07129 [Diaporthe vaccinii]|uniref:Uncharacterized protein n=1 Tax=Diaporthe vaccinii TaxID=105482 RepID=A0ABR4EV82_9PEZI
MQRCGDLPLLANRALVGHRCCRGARQVSLVLINRERWVVLGTAVCKTIWGGRVCRYPGLSNLFKKLQKRHQIFGANRGLSSAETASRVGEGSALLKQGVARP